MMALCEWHRWWALIPRFNAEASLAAYTVAFAAHPATPAEERKGIIDGWFARLGDAVRDAIRAAEDDGPEAPARAQIRRVFRWMAGHGYDVNASGG